MVDATSHPHRLPLQEDVRTIEPIKVPSVNYIVETATTEAAVNVLAMPTTLIPADESGCCTPLLSCRMSGQWRQLAVVRTV